MGSVNVKKRIVDLLQGSFSSTGYYGFPDFAANTDDIISEVYTSPTYSDEDRTNLANWFASEVITVLPEFPRTVAQLPSVFVFRVSDTEDQRNYLGELYDTDIDSDDLNEVITKGVNMLETVEVHLWAQNGGARRDDLYLALREIMIRGMDYLHDAGVELPDWKNGKDGQFYREDLRPHVIHTAQASITYRVPITWNTSSAKIKSVKTNLEGYNDGRVEAVTYRDDT